MRKCSYSALLGTGLAVTVLAIGLAATPSLATTATTWTVKPGRSFSGSSGPFTITDTTAGTGFNCSSSSISGMFKSGSGLAGAKIASITAWSFGECVLFGTYAFVLDTNPSLVQDLNAESYDAASGETTGTVTGIAGAMAGAGCDMTVAGTTSSTPGQVNIKYTNSTHNLVTSGGQLAFLQRRLRLPGFVP
jgi:hypothetical protein